MTTPIWAAEPRTHRDRSVVAALRRADVPLFDPASGGTAARVLLLLESPGPRAATGLRGSGLISMDNNDATAAHAFRGLVESGLPRELTLSWNIVPWYLAAVRTPSSQELSDAAPHLGQLLTLLPDLRVVVLLGRAAQSGWAVSGPAGVAAINAPHPSPQNFNTRPGARVAFVDALRAAAVLSR